MKPVLQAILLADHVYQDRFTGKFVVSGIFSAIAQATASPQQLQHAAVAGDVLAPGMKAGSPTAYLSVTDVKGPVELTLRYADLVDNSILIQATIQLQCDDPLQTIELRIPLPELPIPHPGTYALELLCDEEMLGAHRVRVVSLTPGEQME